MLYLIRSFGRGRRSYLKVGFTDNISTRMNQYRIHNPQFELISTRQGTQEEEKLLQLYLSLTGYKADFLNEWFIDCPEIYQTFHIKINSKLKKFIWRKRDKIFKISDFSNSGMRVLFENLRKLFWKGIYTFNIDREWKFAEAQEYLKRQRKLGQKGSLPL